MAAEGARGQVDARHREGRAADGRHLAAGDGDDGDVRRTLRRTAGQNPTAKDGRVPPAAGPPVRNSSGPGEATAGRRAAPPGADGAGPRREGCETGDAARRDRGLGLLRRRAGHGDAITDGHRADRLGDRLRERASSAVQLTVVCPVLGFCTSMLEPGRAATLPLAPPGGVGRRPAAPAADRSPWRPPALRLPCRGIAPSAGHRASAGQCLHVDVPLLLCLCYSLRRASMGARWAARLAGYTPKAMPMARATTRAPTMAVGLMVIGSPTTPGRKVAPMIPSSAPSAPPMQAEHGRLDQELAADHAVASPRGPCAGRSRGCAR